jgi:ABC-type multidrug transport system permease subunit
LDLLKKTESPFVPLFTALIGKYSSCSDHLPYSQREELFFLVESMMWLLILKNWDTLALDLVIQLIKMVSDDFGTSLVIEDKSLSVDSLANLWNGQASRKQSEESSSLEEPLKHSSPVATSPSRKLLSTTTTLTRRNILNYRKNLLAHGILFAMYVGMGILLGTIWVNLAQNDSHIQDRLSVHFFSVAFLGFMSMAGIPSFLEERGVLHREQSNNLYGAAPFVLANTLFTIPFLFFCALIFAVIAYFAIGLHPGGVYFLRWLSFLYPRVLAAETQSLLTAAIVPIFVAALALAAFLNGFWMCTQDYFISTSSLPRFWYYWAHFINYETYAFALLVRTELVALQFPCDNNCQCSYPSNTCSVSGSPVAEMSEQLVFLFYDVLALFYPTFRV